MTRDLIDLVTESETRIAVLEELETLIQSGHVDNVSISEFCALFLVLLLIHARKNKTTSSLDCVYKERVHTRMNAYRAQTSRKRYSKHPAYIEFKSRVWEVEHEGAMPPLVDLLPAEHGDQEVDVSGIRRHDDHDADGLARGVTIDNEDDDEIVMGGTVRQFRCPITADILRDPVIHAPCQHAYSREALASYMAQAPGRHGSVRCPAAGCQHVLMRSAIHEAPSLKRRVARYERQLLRREEMRREQQDATAVLD